MDLKDTQYKVYHLNNAVPYKFTAGQSTRACNTFADVSKFFSQSLISDKGLLLTTNEQRYISTLAGTFVFVVIKSKVMYIAQMTLKDSRYPKRHCRVT